jgi:peptidoglycan/LPS O-acetylase OafA/YrhL
MIVALISPVAKSIFELPIFTFLGKVSFCLYLTHLIMMQWIWEDIRNILHDEIGWKHTEHSIEAELVMMLPFLILVGYVLHYFIDIPS